LPDIRHVFEPFEVEKGVAFRRLLVVAELYGSASSRARIAHQAAGN
jgi:hypothetical protein